MKHKQIQKFFFLILRILISFGILLYLLRKSDLHKIRQMFSYIVPQYYFLAFFCVVVFQSLIALRWKKICESWNFKGDYLYFLRSYLMGFSLNAIFPGIVAGDTLRAYHLIKLGLDLKRAFFSVFLDRMLGLCGILIILSITLPLMSNFLPSQLKNFLLIVTYIALFFFLFLVIFSRKILNFNLFKPLMPPRIFLPLFLGLVIQILYVWQFIFLSFALNINIKINYFFVVIPIISFLNTLPISISGLGVREGTLSYFFILLDYPIEYGLSLGLLSYSLILLSSLPGIFFYFLPRFRDVQRGSST